MRPGRTCLVLLALVWPASALAVDGVLEINQSCAAVGCFSGDSAGLPVTVQSAGSYRLTSNLLVPDATTDGIVVSAHGVSIDLNGFEIRGPVTCSGSPPACSTGTGSGSGVETTTNGINGVSVRNGWITGMGNYGVWLGGQAEVTALRLRNNRSSAISVNAASIVSDNTITVNGSNGIVTAAGSIVSGNTVVQNASFGIYAGFNSTVHDNVARFNGADGISAEDGSTVSGNTTAYNGGDGIQAAGGSTVQRNTSRGNTSFGLRLSSDASYRENTISNNTGGTVSSGVNMGNNSCNGATLCP